MGEDSKLKNPRETKVMQKLQANISAIIIEEEILGDLADPLIDIEEKDLEVEAEDIPEKEEAQEKEIPERDILQETDMDLETETRVIEERRMVIENIEIDQDLEEDIEINQIPDPEEDEK